MKALTPLLTAGAMAGAAVISARRTPDDLRGEVAIVTGASRGLGLLLARELARQGCPLVICARDSAELDRAAAQLREAGAEVTAVACDVTGGATPSRLVQTALERHGRLDIVLSNAGIIQVGPVQQASPEHFETALDTMALAPARLALEALPVMRGQCHGRIVTIASIGGKLSVPHLLPYSTAKFAAVGFSEGLRAELGRGPVTVTTVVPGLMRTGSHLQARFTGQADEEFTWFALGASLPLISMDAERAARQIIAAVRRRQPEVILTPAGQVVSRVAGLAPGLTSEILHLVQRLMLPGPAEADPAAEGEGTPGQDLDPAFSRKVFDRLTVLGRTAASRFNERLQWSRSGDRARPQPAPPQRPGNPGRLEGRPRPADHSGADLHHFRGPARCPAELITAR
jgi:NAD(P)-dependent dehydrogenase (short-subunit alcohol dehydrogenase family)